jgi:GNAT superfamily N-acetyltransferase
MAVTAPAQIRPFQPGDRGQVLALAPRFTEGVAPWRDPPAVRRVARDWVSTSVYVAIAIDRVVGVVSIRERAHFTGQTHAYVGELAVASGMERRGIATALMNAAEAWAARRGLAFVTLQTGGQHASAVRRVALQGRPANAHVAGHRLAQSKITHAITVTGEPGHYGLAEHHQARALTGSPPAEIGILRASVASIGQRSELSASGATIIGSGLAAPASARRTARQVNSHDVRGDAATA